jgi:hypothetical protein
MVGNVQTPSGTGFDPAPQFWVHRVDPDSSWPLAVIGRCFFGPVRTGLVFDGAASRQDGGWDLSGLIACCLRVEEICIYGRLVDEIDPVVSGRLILSGEAPGNLAPDTVLVARGFPGDDWKLRDGRWVR